MEPKENTRIKLDSLKKMITSPERMEQNRKNIEKELIELLEEELDLEELKELKQLFLLTEKESSGQREKVFAQIVIEFIGIINANTQDRILYAKITYFYEDRPAQVVQCKVSDKLGGRPLGRPLSSGTHCGLNSTQKNHLFCNIIILFRRPIFGEPYATIAFAGKRVIEEVMKIEVPEGVQVYEKRNWYVPFYSVYGIILFYFLLCFAHFGLKILYRGI